MDKTPVAAPARGFPVEEYRARVTKAQGLMAAQDLAGMLLTTEAELRYFSGFQTLFWQSPTRPWFLFLPASGDPVAIIPEIGADLMRRGWITDIRSWSAPCPDDDGLSLLQDLLSPAAKQGAIGLLMGAETHLRMPLGDFELLKQRVPHLCFVDATSVVRELRMVKSKAEIEKLRHICGIGSQLFAQVPALAQPGRPLRDVFRDVRIAGLKAGADDVPYLVGGAGQGGYSDVISPPDTRPLQSGDILMLDTGATWDGYYCDFDRNFAIGTADDLSRRAYDVLWRATNAGVEAAKPGQRCSEVFAAMTAVISELSPEGGDVGRLGHGLGLQLTEWPSFASFDDTILQENMVLTLEPSLNYGQGKIMVHEENIVLRNGRAEILTSRAAPELPVI